MIVCLQDGTLPALENLPATTKLASTVTLTEVVTAAVYGAPMTPGNGDGSFRKACEAQYQEGLVLWRNANGPAWLCEHLKLIAKSETWPFHADTQDDVERRTLDQFDRARRWLAELRRPEVEDEWPDALKEKAKALGAMTDDEAIAHTLAEADRIVRAESAINAKATAFYRLLSEAIQKHDIDLKAIATDRDTGARKAVDAGAPLHKTIPADYFLLNMCHRLFDNEIDVCPPTDLAEVARSVFSRVDEQNARFLVKWTDVSVPQRTAESLLARFRAVPRPSVNVQKRTAVNAAIASLGVANLKKMNQKVREGKIIACVKTDSGLKVSHRFVRDRLKEA